jgi:hypothetical protein
VSGQRDLLRAGFAQSPGLPFADLVPEDAGDELGPADDTIYTPLVTLWMFLSQVLDPLGSCQQAVARLRAWMTGRGMTPCSANTGAYCKARMRLRETGVQALVRRTGTTLSSKSAAAWLWNGRRVRIADGTTATAPDTPANQAAYPQPDGQKPGLGFPMIRLVVVFCLATGAVLEAALAPYRGKGTGELALFRQVWGALDRGDVLVGDRIYCSYFEIAQLSARGVDVVLHKHQSRRTDFRTGRRLGRHDHVVTWDRPARPEWLDEAGYAAVPATLSVREVRVELACPGFRVRRYEVITTLTDPRAVPVSELGAVYRRRWDAELNLRSLKAVTGMGRLRCKSPGLVRTELWVHLLSYNLIRGVMAEAAQRAGLSPGQLSFAGAVQAVAAFAPLLAQTAGAVADMLRQQLWIGVAAHRVGNRPGRVEPRAIKRRKSNYPTLGVPRNLAKQKLLQAA